MKASQQNALVTLLQEGDAQTVGLVKTQLIETGSERLAEYHDLLSLLRGSARRSLEEVISRIEEAQSLGAMSRGLAQLRTWTHLEELCWEMTGAEQPGFDGGPYSRQLDAWAEEARPLLRNVSSDTEMVSVFAHYLAHNVGLLGNSQDYYHPRNCYLPWVMEFRQGLPITLTLIYMLVGLRLGLEVEGIGAPGHFLGRIGTVIFDPYYHGRILSEGDWDLIASEVPLKQRPFLLKPCSPVQTVHRLLVNLRNCYVKLNDLGRRRRIDHYLAVLQR